MSVILRARGRTLMPCNRFDLGLLGTIVGAAREMDVDGVGLMANAHVRCRGIGWRDAKIEACFSIARPGRDEDITASGALDALPKTDSHPHPAASSESDAHATPDHFELVQRKPVLARSAGQSLSKDSGATTINVSAP